MCGVSPVDFWKMHPWEVYWLLDARTADTPARRKSDMHADLYDLLKKTKAEHSQ